MALTESQALGRGTEAPPFSLPDVVSGEAVSLDDYAGRAALVVVFICNHCPYVKHIKEGLAAFGRDYADKDVGVVAISSNNPSTHPQDHPDRMREDAERFGYAFPYLFDETQEVARAYRAVCTPEFYVFDRGRKLVYHGQFDDSRPGNDVPVTGADLRAAVDALLAGRPVPTDQTPSIGCNIKWKPGMAP
jgi:peroxiredoxin